MSKTFYFLTLCPFSSQLINMPNSNGSIQVLYNELLGLPITSLYGWNLKCLKLYSVMSLNCIPVTFNLL